MIEPSRYTRKGLKGWIDGLAIGKERAKYGVSRPDTWSFHDYFGLSMANGLRMMADNTYGFPGDDEFPTHESWVDKLRDLADKLEQASTRGAQHLKAHGEIEWTEADEADWDDFSEYLKRPKTPEWVAWTKKCREIDELAQRNAKEALEWMAEHWHWLWD